MIFLSKKVNIHNKLVRDKIPDIIKNNDEISDFEILDDARYEEELCKKLLEECNEYILDENIEELADIYEVYTAILKLRKIKLAEVQKIALEKVGTNGAFDNKIYLKTSSRK